MVPHVHITPMRAGRALSLRFLATKFGLGMDAFTVRPSFAILCLQTNHTAHTPVLASASAWTPSPCGPSAADPL